MKEPIINIPDIICHAFRHIDSRLNGHGERVAYILMQMFKDKSEISPQEKQNIFMLGLLHDIGAYKEAEIDSMLSFDQDDSLEHSVFAYLLFQTFSPLKEYANIILYHHQCNAQYYSVPISDYHRRLTRILYLADRIDIFCQFNNREGLLPFLEGYRDSVFTAEDIQWFQRADKKYHILDALYTRSYEKELTNYTSTLTFTEEQTHDYLLLFLFAIDFRNEYSALHTSYAIQLSRNIANALDLDMTSCKVTELSILLHNIGKISLTPCSNHKEDYDAYLKNIYETSTRKITKNILNGNVSDEVLETIEQSFHILDCWLNNRPLSVSPAPVSEIVALSYLFSNALTLSSNHSEHQHTALLSFLRNKYRVCSMDDKILSSLEQKYNEIFRKTQISCSAIENTYKQMMEEFHSLNMVLMHYNCKYQ